MTIQKEAIEQYFHVVLLMLYKVVVSFKSGHEALVCNHTKATE